MNCYMKPLCTSVVIALLMTVTAYAVMPPAPPQWYSERLGIPMPDKIKQGMPEVPAAISRDLRKAALLRPSNTDNLLLILVQFPDNDADTANHPQSAYNELIFSAGAIPTGSLVEYLRQAW